MYSTLSTIVYRSLSIGSRDTPRDESGRRRHMNDTSQRFNEVLLNDFEGTTMNAKTTLLIGALTLAAGSAWASESTTSAAPLTRAQVRQSVLAAEAAGQLIPAGEGEIRVAPPSTRSTLTRQQVEHEVIAAERAGQLLPAGEGELRYPEAASVGGSTLARAQVKAETLRALAAGEIIPSGEGSDDRDARHAQTSTLRHAKANG